MPRLAEALDAIKRQGPIPAQRLADLLGIDERAARTLIDRLRHRGEPVWHDPRLGAFWWRDDAMPGKVPRLRWKREFS